MPVVMFGLIVDAFQRAVREEIDFDIIKPVTDEAGDLIINPILCPRMGRVQGDAAIVDNRGFRWSCAAYKSLQL